MPVASPPTDSATAINKPSATTARPSVLRGSILSGSIHQTLLPDATAATEHSLERLPTKGATYTAANMYAGGDSTFTEVARALSNTTVDPKNRILIVDAVRSETGTFIQYVIQTASVVVKRRYSEFESLRKVLGRHYAAVIIPPIPEKQSLTEYATTSKVKEDQQLIERRKRMLKRFLNKVAAHPILGADQHFRLFLQAPVWTDVLFDQKLPKAKSDESVDSMPQDSEGTESASPTSPAPTPGSTPATLPPQAIERSLSKQLRNPDPKFAESETYTLQFSKHIVALNKVHRRISKRYAAMATDMAELGATYNGFSLHEADTDPKVSAAIERVGQAVDSTFLATNSLVTSMDEHFTEPLHEYEQYASIIKHGVLRLRHSLALHLEELGETLDTKRSQLASLEAGAHVSDVKTGFSGLRSKVESMLDSDPEDSRRKMIAKLRDQIVRMEQERETTTSELGRIAIEVQQELDRYQQQKVQDVRDMLIAYTQAQIKFINKNIDAWSQAKKEVDAIRDGTV